MNLGDLVRRNALARGPRPALSGGRDTLTWAEVNERVNRLVHATTELGLVPGDRVGVIARNSPRYWEVTFACSKAGLVLVPVNYRLSRSEVAHIQHDAEPRCWFVDRASDGLLPDPAPMRIHLDDGGPAHGHRYESLLSEASPVEPSRAGLPSDPLAVIGYTSGTTGVPKGAMLSSRERVTAAVEFALIMAVTEDTRFLACMPSYVHRGGSGSFSPTVVGGHTIVVEFSAASVLKGIEEHRATMIMLAPAMIDAILQHPEVDSFDLGSLRQLWTTGGPTGPSRLRELMDLLPGCAIGSSYGMTEATGIANCVFDRNLPNELLARQLSAAGRPMPLMDVRVVTDDLSDVPPGGIGEVVVRGATCMTGYWKDPELTDRRTPDGWFRTGDIGHFDDDGYLILVDRSTDIINSGGLNVYSAEVERVLLEHPGIAEVAVVSAPHDRWGEQVCAYIVARPGVQVDADTVTAWCEGRLGAYKRPRLLHFAAELPRNQMGKVLKRQLRDRNWSGSGTGISNTDLANGS